MTRAHSSRSGFTLIEVLIALAVGGMAVAAAAALLHGLGDRAEAVTHAAREFDRDANGERLLRALFANLDLTGESSPTVTGDARSARFRAWCPTPTGWLGRCEGRLFFAPGENGVRLRIEVAGADGTSSTLTLRDGMSGRLRYLVDPTTGGVWADTWSRRTVPAAIAVIVDADTLLLAVWHGG